MNNKKTRLNDKVIDITSNDKIFLIDDLNYKFYRCNKKISKISRTGYIVGFTKSDFVLDKKR